MFDDMLTQTVTVLRSSQGTSTVDAEGFATNSPTEVDYPGLIQQRAAAEVIVGPDTLISDHLLFLGPDAEIDGRDQVRAGDQLYDIVGQPAVVSTPRGPHHIEADLQLVVN